METKKSQIVKHNSIFFTLVNYPLLSHQIWESQVGSHLDPLSLLFLICFSSVITFVWARAKGRKNLRCSRKSVSRLELYFFRIKFHCSEVKGVSPPRPPPPRVNSSLFCCMLHLCSGLFEIMAPQEFSSFFSLFFINTYLSYFFTVFRQWLRRFHLTFYRYFVSNQAKLYHGPVSITTKKGEIL